LPTGYCTPSFSRVTFEVSPSGEKMLTSDPTARKLASSPSLRCTAGFPTFSDFMHWIAPSERDAATDTLEKRLWAAADQLRANSGLTSQQYGQPVLGLIFLRFAELRFIAQRARLEKASAKGGSGHSSLRISDLGRVVTGKMPPSAHPELVGRDIRSSRRPTLTALRVTLSRSVSFHQKDGTTSSG